MEDRSASDLSRRGFLRRALLSGAGVSGLGRLHQAFAGTVSDHPPEPRGDGGYGGLKTARDQATGMYLLKLPKGFRYLSFGWTGDPLESGRPTPGAHDGTAAFGRDDGKIVLVRNHEVRYAKGAFDEGPAYDRRASGGTTTLVFDPEREKLVEARASLLGTMVNCAGGPTPWGTWLSCEETLAGRGDLPGLKKPHGYVFEVPLDRPSDARPIPAMGRMFHEAAAVDPKTSIVYHTEDRKTAGFYRFLPRKKGDLHAGGKLQMLAVEDFPHLDTRRTQLVGRRYRCTWVDIDDPERPHSKEDPGDCLGVFLQGERQGGATFGRLEGLWWGRDQVFFTSTSGGDAYAGQVWSYQPRTRTLELVYEAPNRQVLTGPDNLTVSPRGGILICEDGSGRPMRLNLLTRAGKIIPFAESRVRLNGKRNGFRGDFRFKEFTGACFSPDGKWLFVNAQKPGITFAITGPWETGEL